MRIGEKHIRNEMGMFMINYALCILLSFVYMDGGLVFPAEKLPVTIGMGVINGTLFLTAFLFLKLNMKYNGIVMASTFMKLGVLIPTIMAIVVFGESPRFTQIMGILIAIAAIVLNHFEKDALQESNKKIWLLVLMCISGVTDSMANVFDKVGNADAQDAYLFITFLVAFLLALIAALRGKSKITVKDVLFGIVIGVPNYYSARFLLLALSKVDAVLAYPTYSVATIVIITVAGIAAFHEKVSKKKMLALGMIAAALVLLNV
jgi:drug/metabolite transporter (DMT)-like permease